MEEKGKERGVVCIFCDSSVIHDDGRICDEIYSKQRAYTCVPIILSSYESLRPTVTSNRI